MDDEETPRVIIPIQGSQPLYPSIQDSIVRRILKEIDEDGYLTYKVVFEDGHTETVDFDKLMQLENGAAALGWFQQDQEDPSDDSEDDLHASRGRPPYSSQSASEERIVLDGESDDDKLGDSSEEQTVGRGLRPRRAQQRQRMPRYSSQGSSTLERRTRPRRSLRSHGAVGQRQLTDFMDEESSDDLDVFKSDIIGSKKRKRSTRGSSGRDAKVQRQSQRSTRAQGSMREARLEDVFRSDSDSREGRGPVVPKAVGARESFKPLDSSDPFKLRHVQQCETCGDYGDGPRGQLIYCQGCSLAYHKGCLGYRSHRDHLVTKIGPNNFVLQCKRCICLAKRKEPTAPDHGICQSCRQPGSSCRPFRARRTAAQEEKEREDNHGEDPIAPVEQSRINNVSNVLFRCVTCWRAYHFHHLRSKTDNTDTGADDETMADLRYHEYANTWQCLDCQKVEQMKTKVGELVAWRPVNAVEYDPSLGGSQVNEDDKEYLVKWDNRSYFQVEWMPGAWMWGVTPVIKRRAFAKMHDMPIMTAKDAIPEDYLRIDIVLSVKFTSIVTTQAEEVDKARVREVDQALIKYKGLGYEDTVWDKPPTPDDGERWTDFVRAYERWVMGRYVRCPKSTPMKNRLDKARSQPFTELEKKQQPESLAKNGKELMKYQLDGLNWLYYRWYLKQNAILADEMGLGKTIQVIGALAALVESHNCFPFLIVVPNSTCPNWRREIEDWAPGLRAVAYFGSAQARKMVHNYELYPEGAKDLRAHVVITSYEAATDDTSRAFFKGVSWQGLIVDEGQRLKNDASILYEKLSSLKIGFRVLLTGTPLQNNARELFNLLQFLDDSFDAASLELEYAELTKQSIPKLHNLIRPFFLRRTKAQVLTFLPPMAQIILPVSMSLVQRKLYLSILAKNPELVRAIFDKNTTLRSSDRANLRNILMQLRKCLCHPFVYSRDIEDRTVIEAKASHRQLVEASAKLQLLDVLLPKLQARGHRVLLFSQFLNMLDIAEDFLDGLSMQYQRLDGSLSALEKQKRIDQFNAPDSSLFAFLLSTRAGGVGINLATADTVIILDPDFNPHQDIQALSRAHRIGQQKKVLCFQLMTRSSAEEKIVQVGRKKMALDHVLIEKMDADEDEGVDFESVLRHGVADLMDDSIPDIKYDEASIDKLLDRSLIEDTRAGEDNSAESQFSFARVWANDNESLADSLESDDEVDRAPEASAWDRILQERERQAAEEAAARAQVLGRGKRARQAVDYGRYEHAGGGARAGGGERSEADDDDDTDFMDVGRSDDEEHDDEGDGMGDRGHALTSELLQIQQAARASTTTTVSGLASGAVRGTQPSAAAAAAAASGEQQGQVRAFRRANVVWPRATQMQPGQTARCIACGTWHQAGYCPFKLAGAEHCNLCGLAHYGVARTCPHIRSETQVRAMIAALKQSPEPGHLVELASKYLKGVKGTLVQQKKIKAQRAEEERLARAGGGGRGGASHASGATGGSGGSGGASSAPHGQVVTAGGGGSGGGAGQAQQAYGGAPPHQQPGGAERPVGATTTLAAAAATRGVPEQRLPPVGGHGWAATNSARAGGGGAY